LVEVVGTPFAKAYPQEDGFIRTEIRLNVSKTNILRPSSAREGVVDEDMIDNEEENYDTNISDFTLDDDDFN
jgi:hypothetical protein